MQQLKHRESVSDGN